MERSCLHYDSGEELAGWLPVRLGDDLPLPLVAICVHDQEHNMSIATTSPSSGSNWESNHNDGGRNAATCSVIQH